MTYQSTITRKGQVTIPNFLRRKLGIKTPSKMIFELALKNGGIILKPANDFLEIARNLEVKKKINPLKARESMEKSYERR